MEHILAIDPGTEKNGVAVVAANGEVACKCIVANEKLRDFLIRLIDQYQIKKIVVGNRTGSKATIKYMKDAGLADKVEEILPIDEHRSTEEARKRFWVENSPKGLWKLIPTSMQTPPRPIDDYVAVILAERYLHKML